MLGGAATATFLLGVALLYGGTASLSLAVVHGIALGSARQLAIAAVVLVLIAFFLKAAIVPFHAWAPDAYEGASVPVTAYMATIVKAGCCWRCCASFGEMPLSRLDGRHGRAAAAGLDHLGQPGGDAARSLRRMIAYSSIAHAGYLFYAFLGNGPGRYQAVMFYVLVYGLMKLLAFAGAAAQRRRRVARPPRQDEGALPPRPVRRSMIAIAMLSLAGIPPMPGFIAKFLIFKNVMAAGYTTYAVLGLVGSYLGIYFYLRVIQFLFMSPEAAHEGRYATTHAAIGASLVCLLPAVLVAVFPGMLIGPA